MGISAIREDKTIIKDGEVRTDCPMDFLEEMDIWAVQIDDEGNVDIEYNSLDHGIGDARIRQQLENAWNQGKNPNVPADLPPQAEARIKEIDV